MEGGIRSEIILFIDFWTVFSAGDGDRLSAVSPKKKMDRPAWCQLFVFLVHQSATDCLYSFFEPVDPSFWFMDGKYRQ